MKISTNSGRIVCQFSCGAASAVATKLVLSEKHPDILIVNAFIQEEHADNRRFAADCERWFGHPITVVQNDKYNASTDEVWHRKRYMKGPHGAPCSVELKQKPIKAVCRPDDTHVIGFTVEEEDRAHDLTQATPDRKLRFPLIERGLSKADCLTIVADAGIELPLPYRLGFDNANCLGCPKGGQNYHKHIRKHFPDRHAALVQIQDSIGPGAYFLQYRSGPMKGERMALRDLPVGDGDMSNEPSFSCSFFCQIAKEDVA